MKCEQIRDLLSPYVDGMVDDKDKALIDAHIAACPKCRQQVEDYRHIANMMRKIETPSLPGSFSADLNRRVRDEQNKILNSYPMKTPKKSGWFAATLAVFALTGGIYASSHWSLGSIVTAWHDSEDDQKKPLISIDSIIERFQQWQGNDDSKDDLIQKDNDRNGAGNKPVMKVVKAKEPSSNSAVNEIITEDGNNHTSTLKVENIEESLTQVLKIASNYGAGYTIITPEENLSEDDRQISRKILLEVTESEAQQIIKEIEALGLPLVNDEVASSMQAGDGANNIDPVNQDQGVKDKSPKEESLMDASAKDESMKKESAREASPNEESLNEESESPKDEPVKKAPQNEESSKEGSLKEESPQEEFQTQPLAEQVENSEPELLLKQDNPAEQPDDENSTIDKENKNDKKITLSIYLIEEKTQVQP
ncbi:MAG: zf-HC2 domain-containing protein [Syntrophomonadaceae bacterium]|nr:zf-HC2 domain-containing protein [Syntrophomonadaceae bacterium]